MTGADNVKLL